MTDGRPRTAAANTAPQQVEPAPTSSVMILPVMVLTWICMVAALASKTRKAEALSVKIEAVEKVPEIRLAEWW